MSQAERSWGNRMLIDVHAHLTEDCFQDIDHVMAEIAKAGVGAVICSGYDMPSSYAAMRLSEQFESVYFCAGYQPQELGKYVDGDMDKLRQLVRHEKCVAVGEIGLDYHYENNPPKAVQKELFEAQIHLADEEGLPIVIHSRDCANDTLTMLRENSDKLRHGGLLHCYSYSADMVGLFESLGMYFSFGGTSTYKNANKVKKSACAVSDERILTETDSPYLTPVPFRGTFPNTPAYIPYIARNLVALRGEEEAAFVRQVFQNARRLFSKMRI